jgi:hypothetical protein
MGGELQNARVPGGALPNSSSSSVDVEAIGMHSDGEAEHAELRFQRLELQNQVFEEPAARILICISKLLIFRR